jgi:hypothetical protein
MTSVGVVSGGGTDPNMPDPPPGDGGPGVEPEPVLPAPVDFITPSTPTLSGTVQGLRVSWDGLNSAGNRYPSDVYVEVHYATSGATFTPSSSTLAGTLLGSAGFFTIMGLSAGTTYYVRLVGVDAKGNRTDPSTAASSQTGLTTSSDYGTATIGSGAVSFNARQIGGITTTVGTTQPSSPVAGDIWLDSSGGAIVHKRWNGSAWVTQAWGSDSLSANCITAVQIAAGAITAGAIAANAITAEKINAGAITADKITSSAITADKIASNAVTAAKIEAGAVTADKISATAIDGKTITGALIRTSSGSTRAVLGDGAAASLDYYYFGTLRGFITGYSAGLSIYGNPDVNILANLDVDGGINVSAAASDFPGVYSNNTTGLDSVGITSVGRLRRLSSSQDIKYDITPLAGTLSESVEPSRITDVVTVDPYAVLDVAVTEFSVIDRYFPPLPADAELGTQPPPPEPVPTEQRVLGFIADDVAEKLPVAVTRDASGKPAGVLDTAMIAALLAVVKEQQTRITDLTARIEALEA